MKLVGFCLARCEDRRRAATRPAQARDAVSLAGRVTQWGRSALVGDVAVRAQVVERLLEVARRDADHPDFLADWRDDEALTRWLTG